MIQRCCQHCGGAMRPVEPRLIAGKLIKFECLECGDGGAEQGAGVRGGEPGGAGPRLRAVAAPTMQGRARKRRG